MNWTRVKCDCDAIVLHQAFVTCWSLSEHVLLLLDATDFSRVSSRGAFLPSLCIYSQVPTSRYY